MVCQSKHGLISVASVIAVVMVCLGVDAAELKIVSPEEGAVVSLLTPSQKGFYDLPRAARVNAVTNESRLLELEGDFRLGVQAAVRR